LAAWLWPFRSRPYALIRTVPDALDLNRIVTRYVVDDSFVVATDQRPMPGW
jgi:hypothetical protein